MRFSKAVLSTLLCIVLGVLGVLGQVAGADETPSRPNIVFIYADDWRWDCMGIVQREQGERSRFPWLETPRLDEFAKQSMRFRQSFVVNSLCSPGRACVLTGRYSHRNGIINNSTPLPVDTVTIATRLKDAGYTTAYCGKWHMDAQRERPGFDYVASFVGQGKYFDCPILLNGRQTPTQGWIDDVSTDYAIKFVEEQSKDKPFFLWLGLKSPHGPRGGKNLPERVRELYAKDESRTVPNFGLQPIFQNNNAQQKPTDAPKLRGRQREREFEGHRSYMRHITAIDGCIGRVLDAIERTGQADNTIVMITSDNGYYLGEHGLGDKRSAYEESIRVPLLVRLPGESEPRGVTSDAMVLNIDYGPTILDFAGAAPLPDAQGRSLRPLLSGEAPANWRTAFLYEYFKEGQYVSPTVLAVRTATHKLIKYPGHDEWTELFDLANDPYETKNLTANSALMEQLRAVYDAEMVAVSFRMPENVESGKNRPGRRGGRSRTANGR